MHRKPNKTSTCASSNIANNPNNNSTPAQRKALLAYQHCSCFDHSTAAAADTRTHIQVVAVHSHHHTRILVEEAAVRIVAVVDHRRTRDSGHSSDHIGLDFDIDSGWDYRPLVEAFGSHPGLSSVVAAAVAPGTTAEGNSCRPWLIVAAVVSKFVVYRCL